MSVPPLRPASRAFAFALGLALAPGFSAAVSAQEAPTSPVFQSDTAGMHAIRAAEAGSLRDSARAAPRADSLRAKLRRRGPFIGLTAGASFGAHSARDRFAAEMTAQANAAGEKVLQPQDPVHLHFPVGLMLGFPLLEHFDGLLRTEHFYYRIAGLAQKDNEAATEYWYVHQVHLAGAGVRWLVPNSLLTVNGRAGLYLSYVRFWNFGPSGLRSPSGSVRSRTAAAGAGGELQVGFQQDFDHRWSLTGGLSLSNLAFESDGDWGNVTPSSGGQPAEWSLQSARFMLQGIYQIGR